MSAHRSPLREGVAALAKSAILVAGVPVALARLWLLTRLPAHLFSRGGLADVSTWSHAAILAVGLIWAFASARLLRELSAALRRREMPGSTWSARWAIAIAALIAGATASPSLLPPAHSPRPVPAAPAPKRAVAGSRNDAAFVSSLPDECLSALAERVGLCADDWPAIAALNFGRLQADGGRLLDPVRLKGGWRLRLPGRGGPRSLTHAGASGSLPVEPELVGLSVVALCALALRLRALRRRNAALRRRGELPPPPTRPVAAAQAAIEPYADAPLLEWIDAANRLLSAAEDGDGGAPDVRLVRAGPDGVEFLLAEAVEQAPFGFRVERGGRWWRLDPLLDLAGLRRAANGRLPACPVLVPVGDDESSSYLIPLRPGRQLGITGDPAAIDSALSAIVNALRVVPWADQCSIELIGIGAPPLSEQAYHLQPSGDGALHALADSAEARVLPPQADLDPAAPVIVIAREALGGADDDALARASAVAGLIVAGRGGTDVLHVDADGAVLHPFAIAVSGILPSDDQRALVDSLLEIASRPPEPVPIPAASPGSVELRAIPAPARVECRVLRPEPEVFGWARPPFRHDAARVVECLAYLLTHDPPIGVHQVAEALFARSSEEMRADRVEHTLAALRASLGSDATGRPLITRAGDGIALDGDVGSDWARACCAIGAARGADPERAVSLLRDALELVEGPPCARALGGFAWLRAEGIADEIEGTIVDAAHQLCALALADNDAGLAGWAVERGRRCVPESEILARDLMTVNDATSDRDAVRATYAELEAALERLGHNEPSAESRALLEALDHD